MALEKDFELLDSYLSNKLSGAEKAAFEQKLSADPALASEYRLQQQVVEGLRQARVSELKSMLQAVAIPPSAGVGISAGVKALIGVTVAGLVATGIFFYLQPAEEAPVQQTELMEPATAPEENEPQPIADSAVTTPTPISEEPASVKAEQRPAKKEVVVPAQPEVVVAPKTKDSIAKSVEVFDPNEDSAAKAPERVVTERAPKPATNKSSLSVKTDSKNKKYNFHYQFKNGELFLYGPFDKKLVDIMEFFSENKHTIFLYHESKYYLLSEANEKVKPLTPITDHNLLKKLKENRGK